MLMLFSADINGPDDWAAVFTDKSAFRLLVREAMTRHGLPADAPPENLTPGTNAVFRSGDYVVKLFAPEGSGFYAPEDFRAEIASYALCEENGVPCAKIFGSGEIRDKYLFRYIIYGFIREAYPYMSVFGRPADRRAVFAKKLRKIAERMNVPVNGADIAPLCKRNSSMRISRMNGLSEGLVRGLCMPPEKAGMSVFCHGDLTAENILITDRDEPVLIDFADAVIAPREYELTPLVFEAFRADGAMVRAFIGDTDPDAFIDALVDSLRMHLFAGNCIKEFFGREGIDPASVGSVGCLRDIIKRKLFS